jgi:predicted acylesterase/phospholipase RssA
MAKLGLALSGGGFRATLFHLGVVRFLRDAGALRDVTDIASVSGGSILAAHLVLNWDQYNGDEQRFTEAASISKPTTRPTLPPCGSCSPRTAPIATTASCTTPLIGARPPN